MTARTVRGRGEGGESAGATIRAARAARGMSLADLHTATKVAVRLLAALEEDHYEELPPIAFTRGFVKSVARELGLDPVPLLRAVESAMGAAARTKPAVASLEVAVVPAARRSGRRRLLAVAGAAAIFLAAAVSYSVYRQVREFDLPFPTAVTPSPEPVSPAASPQAAPSPQVASPAQPATAASPPTADIGSQAGAGAGGSVTIEMSATGRSWIRVSAGGRLVYEGFIGAGQQRRWQASGPVTVRLGNAGAVALTVNGRALGVIGGSGEVVERTFGGE